MHSRAKRSAVAQAAGVSESTVSRALSNPGLISKETVERVKHAAQTLGYIPCSQAMRFARRKTFHIGFVVRVYPAFTPFSRAYFPTLLDGAVLGADERNYYVTIIPDHTAGKPTDLVRIVRSREVDGLLLPIVPIGDTRLDDLSRQNVPFVLINDYREDCFSVDTRPEPGMRKAFEYAWGLGHRSFGYITGDVRYRNARDRFDVFQRLAAEFTVASRCEKGDFSRTSGYRQAGKMLQGGAPPTVIMTASDRAALGVLEYCREHKIDVPGSVSVIGFDNLFPSGDIIPSLTTIDNPIQKAGTAAARLLIDKLENKWHEPVNEWLDTDFIIRQSTGPAVN